MGQCNEAVQKKDSDFEFKDDTTELKLNAIKKTLMPSKNFKVAGVYNQKRPNLNTEYLIGSIDALKIPFRQYFKSVLMLFQNYFSVTVPE